MTRFEEKLYFQSVFDAIDQVYKIKKSQQNSSYEERLRASFNKLLVPDWYNHEYTSTNGLRKTKSHGHVPRVKRTNNNHYETPDTSISSSSNHSPYLSNGTHRQSYRHRSPSRSWSERPPIRHDSTTSSYDTNGSIINGRRSTNSNGSSSYAPGVQRVAQSSTWYKPRTFATKSINGNTNGNGHSIEPPRPLPRYSKIDQERIYSLDSSSLKIENVRYPIKPRTMAQAQIPTEESFLNISSDADVTLVQKSPESSIPPQSITENNLTNIPRTNSLKSISSETESYSSAILPFADKNLLATDSSSYASVNERCLSPSTASYHTAIADDTSSSITGYETPTPQLDDEDDNDNKTLSSHSSLSDLSRTETIEPNTEDLDIAAVSSTAEQKSLNLPSTDIEMENTLYIDKTLTNNNNNNVQSIENTNWYDGSLDTCIQQTTQPIQIESSELREISNDEILREIDINAVGDEFFLFSPRNSTDDEPSTKEIVENSNSTSKRIFTMEDKIHFDPFDFDNNNNNNSSIMITNLDDILIDDDDDDDSYSSNNFSNGNYRRPIQEDILYEVEHENSFSDHSQNTSSIIPTDDKISIKHDVNIDYLTSIDNPIQENENQSSSSSPPPPLTNDTNILPIYILPPLFTTTTTTTTTEPSSSLHIDTNNNFQKWDSLIHKYPDLTSPSAYTSKIRHRHYSVGSYYDNKTTTVTVHPNQTYYFLGSAPVSPLSRVSTTNNESYYQQHHHSPIMYDNISLNALRRVNPFVESNTYSNIDYKRPTDYRSSSLTREERTRVITYTSPTMTTKSVQRTNPETSPSIISQPIISTRTSSITFPQYEIPIIHSKPNQDIPTTTSSFKQQSSIIREKNPILPSRFSPPEQESSLVRPKISRSHLRPSPPPPPPLPTRTKSIEKDQIQNIYQKIDSTSTDDDDDNNKRLPTPNADLQFIRGAIERVFHFNGESTTDTTSESSTHYEEVENENHKQYPAVAAIQRFYNHKNLSDLNKPTTNINQEHSSTSKQSPLIIVRKNLHSKSSQHEPTSSEEIDDTLNDIEDVDYHNDKTKHRMILNHSPPTSSETSIDNQSKIKKSSQETQTIGRSKPIVRSTVPPIDIVTEMIIEQDDDNVQIDDVDGDMVIFYDDIEIVEHSTSSCSSESDSTSASASSSSHLYSKPINTLINQQIPPPIPARTLKPSRLLSDNNDNHQQQQQSPSTPNKTYESVRKKFDINSVNDMLNRTEQNLSSSITHRHPSARHFVGKLNNDDSSTQSSITNGGHQQRIIPIKKSSTTLPTRSIIADTNALVKQIQNSLSRNSLHDTKLNSNNLSTSNKDLRAFVSTTYSPSNENMINNNNNETIHTRQQTNNHDDQTFKRHARLSKSFHNVSEYNTNNTNTTTTKKEIQTQPSKSVENNLDQLPQNQSKPSLNLTSLVTSTSFSALPNSDDNARMLSMKWYTGQVSENSEICYNTQHIHSDDLLHGYISTHSNRETQDLLTNLQKSNDARIHAALDDIRSRVIQFDASKTQEDLHVFMRYLESRLRDLNNKKSISNGHKKLDNNTITKDKSSTRQFGRQHIRSSTSTIEENANNHHQPTPPRRSSQSNTNQENPAVFDEMLNTVLGLPKKDVSVLPQTYPFKREKSAPLIPTQITTNTTVGRGIGKRLFESGTYKDPRLIYDGPKRKEKEEQPLETSV